MTIAIKSALTLGSIIGAKRLARFLSQYDLDDALSVVGLERRPSATETALPALGLVALGAVLGASAALIFAPSSGRELRERILGRVDDAKHRLEDAADRNFNRTGYSNQTAS